MKDEIMNPNGIFLSDVRSGIKSVATCFRILGAVSSRPRCNSYSSFSCVSSLALISLRLHSISTVTAMGTLTGAIPTRPDHCPHKLPSSCRLTATSTCCACQDVRPHSASGYYSVYIDGVGLVNRGTRWQRYCYFCKEFWQNRLLATDPPMESNQTKVPEVPDQSQFLERWFDYHRGYKIVQGEGEGGQEERIECKPEIDWRQVDPGTLPIKNDVERLARTRHAPVVRIQAEPGVSIESALDALLGEAEEDNMAVPHGHIAQTVEAPRAETSRGPTEADIQAAQQAKDKLDEADRLLADVEALHQRLTQELATAESQLRERQSERRIALREHRGAQQLLRVLESQNRNRERDAARLARVWGSREEIAQQGANYVSPLAQMFTRAYERYRVAEEVRAEERASDEMTERQEQLIRSLGPWWNGGAISDADYAAELEVPREEEKLQTLDDEESGRPEPKTDEEMTVPLICKICLQQPADIAVLPCGHMTMCQYCADVYMPIKDDDQTRLVRKVPCPLPYCKKQVKRRVKIFIS